MATTDVSTENTTSTVKVETFEKSLQKTELGEVLLKYKSVFIALFVVVALGLVGKTVYDQMISNKSDGYATQIYEFEKSTLKDFQENKINKEQLVASYKELAAKMGSFDGVYALAITLFDELYNKKAYQEALEVSKVGFISKNKYALYMAGLRMAALYEDLGQTNDAVTELEKLTSNPAKLMEGKVYLDLGRLYLQSGNKDKAKTSLDYVINNTEDEEFKKMARLLVEGI